MLQPRDTSASKGGPASFIGSLMLAPDGYRIGEAILSTQGANTSCGSHDCKCIQGMKESASLIDRPAWPRKNGPPLRTIIRESRKYCLNPIEVLESKGHSNQTRNTKKPRSHIKNLAWPQVPISLQDCSHSLTARLPSLEAKICAVAMIFLI
jgi:hypothetical protein